MGRFAIRGLLSRKLRTALTAIAIVLGVAMISGTFVLTDSIDQAFDRIFTDIRQGSNAVISGKSAFDFGDRQGVTAPTLDESLLPKVRALPGVAEAEGSVDSDATQFIGDDGKAVVFGGAPNLGFSIANGDSVFNPLTLIEGDWPGRTRSWSTRRRRPRRTSRSARRSACRPRGRSSGCGSRGSSSSAPASRSAARRSPASTFRPRSASSRRSGSSTRSPSPRSRTSRTRSSSREIEEILPPDAQVLTGERAGAVRRRRDTNEFISFLRTFLLAFGGIALFVGSFVIANSLSITIAQRTREFATLRTIGATNRQILGSVIVEALVVGVVASVVGLFLGLLLAKGLFELFDAVGFTLPNTGLVFEPRTIVVALAAGILVTLLASVYPGFRATTVPPIAAVREGAVLPGEPLDRIRGTWLAAARHRASVSRSASSPSARGR